MNISDWPNGAKHCSTERCIVRTAHARSARCGGRPPWIYIPPTASGTTTIPYTTTVTNHTQNPSWIIGGAVSCEHIRLAESGHGLLNRALPCKDATHTKRKVWRPAALNLYTAHGKRYSNHTLHHNIDKPLQKSVLDFREPPCLVNTSGWLNGAKGCSTERCLVVRTPHAQSARCAARREFIYRPGQAVLQPPAWLNKARGCRTNATTSVCPSQCPSQCLSQPMCLFQPWSQCCPLWWILRTMCSRNTASACLHQCSTELFVRIRST